MTDWITTDEALAIGREQYQQEYHIEYLRQLLRSKQVRGRKFGPIWQVYKPSWIERLDSAANSQDRRRGGRPSESTT